MAGIEFLSSNTNTATLTNSTDSATVYATKRRCSCNKSQTDVNNYNTRHSRPSALCLVVMMAFIVIMPHNVDAAAVRRHLSASATSSQTSAEMERLLLLSSSAKEELSEDDLYEDSSLESASQSSESSSASESSSDTYDSLSPLEVMKHRERKDEHQKDRRSNLRKRQINHLDNLRYFDGSSHQIEWHNPCNVARAVQNVNAPNIPRRGYYYLKNFKDNVRKELITRHLGLKQINIDDMESWRLHRDNYKFLPKLRQNSKLTLSRWYSNMQIFVASFAYLGRTQYNWDMAKKQYVSETTKELDQLLTSARLILCELETTINGSHPNKNVKMLKSLSREEMDDKLAFQTREAQGNSAAVVEPTTLDLKFAKDTYFKYLQSMRKVLKAKLKNKDHRVQMESAENASAETNNKGADDWNSKINMSSMMHSESNMSLGESFELSMKSQEKRKQAA